MNSVKWDDHHRTESQIHAYLNFLNHTWVINFGFLTIVNEEFSQINQFQILCWHISNQWWYLCRWLLMCFVRRRLTWYLGKRSVRKRLKKAILTAAGRLFSRRGYDSVTVREIAKEASCSHTTIYVYFKDKEELLHELTMPGLLEWKESFESIASRIDIIAKLKLMEMSFEFLRFCLRNKSMYSIFIYYRGNKSRRYGS